MTPQWALACAAALGCLVSVPASAGDKPGSGSQRLVVDALSQAQARFAPDACFTGMYAVIGLAVHGIDPAKPKRRKEYLVDKFHFQFYAPSRWKETFEADICVPTPPAPPDGGLAACAPNQWKTKSGAARGERNCVTDMDVDSGDALEIATKSGLLSAPEGVHLLLTNVKDRRSRFWGTAKALREKTVWLVHSLDDCRFIDAGTGQVVLKKSCDLDVPALFRKPDASRQKPEDAEPKPAPAAKPPPEWRH